jgi:hypothetical protein
VSLEDLLVGDDDLRTFRRVFLCVRLFGHGARVLRA